MNVISRLPDNVYSRRRPYSHTSSIKSIIHGPNIEDIEAELRKLEIEQEEEFNARARSANRLSANAKNSADIREGSANSSRRSSVVSSKLQQTVDEKSVVSEEPQSAKLLKNRHARALSARSSTKNNAVEKGEILGSSKSNNMRRARPKTCIAAFTSPGSNNHHGNKRLRDKFSEFPTSAQQGEVQTPLLLSSAVRHPGDPETLAERYQWGVRGSALADSANYDTREPSRRRVKPRVSASAPPRSSASKASFFLGHLAGQPRSQSARAVEAFTPASRMRNTYVIAPKRLKVFEPRPSPPTTFRRMYERGDIPVTILHDHRGQSLRWKVDLSKLDYGQYLPLFFDGLRETRHPYDFFSRAGVRDLLANGGDKIVPLIPQLILPMKSALNTRIPGVVCTVLKVLQELLQAAPGAGEAIVPYYRQLLPTLNLFQHVNVNCGDEIDYSQQRRENLGDLIQETLEMLERHGGKDAYINIKYMVPTYQSCAAT